MACKDVPVLIYGESNKTSIRQVIKRGLESGHINLCNLGLEQLPNQFLQLLPATFVSNSFQGLHEKISKEMPFVVEAGDSSLQSEASGDAKESDHLTDARCQELSTMEEGACAMRAPSKKSFYMEISSDVIPEESYLSIVRLTLSCNKFTIIPVAACLMDQLQILDMQDNKIRLLPKEIKFLKSLTCLIISHNELLELNDELFELKNLHQLYAQDNQISTMSSRVEKVTMLEVLDISNNRLGSIPSEIGNLPRLNRLNVSNNMLLTVPNELSLLEALQILDLSNNCLTEFPVDYGGMQLLKYLSLRNNYLVQFPELSMCRSLKELHCGGNNLPHIHGDILSRLGELRLLDLAENKLKSLPDEIGNLTNLTRLDVAKNNLTDLPSSLGFLKNLKTLTVEGNPFDSFTRITMCNGTSNILKYLRHRQEVNYTDTCPSLKPYTEIDQTYSPTFLSQEEVKMLQYTKTLNYSLRNCDQIPDQVFFIGLEHKINSVKIAHNNLVEVPTRLKDLLHLLKELDLSYNLLLVIPSFLGYATNLRILDLQSNQLKSLPDELAYLHQLSKINITNNRFREIPPVLFKITWLEMLFLGNNSITDINLKGLRLMTNLQVLDLINNDIMHLPYELGNMTHLRRLQLEGNPFRQPKSNVLSRGTTHILEWLRNRIPDQ